MILGEIRKGLLLVAGLFVLAAAVSTAGAQTFVGFDGYMVKDEAVPEQEWRMAASHRAEYNCRRDTSDWFKNKEAEVAVFRTLEDWEKEAYVWTDFGLTNIGTFSERNETIVDIWYANDMMAVFVDNGVADTCRIAGSLCGTYSKDGIYVGAELFDCDGYVHLFFYQHVESAVQCHIRLLGEYKCYEAVITEDPHDNPLLWYRGCLYWKGYGGRVAGEGNYVYHKLTISKGKASTTD